MNRILAAAVLGLSLLSGTTHASVITFDGLSGVNGSAFSTYQEAGFQVDSHTGTWVEAHNFGAPVPSIFSGSTTSSVDVTSVGLGTFTFTGVDLGNAGLGIPTYTIEGFLGNVLVLTTSGSLATLQSFVSIASPNLTQAIDLLRISFDIGSTSSYNIDNIGVNPINSVATPEPATLASAGMAVVIGLAVRRRRRAG